jgi:hypothetical protein
MHEQASFTKQQLAISTMSFSLMKYQINPLHAWAAQPSNYGPGHSCCTGSQMQWLGPHPKISRRAHSGKASMYRRLELYLHTSDQAVRCIAAAASPEKPQESKPPQQGVASVYQHPAAKEAQTPPYNQGTPQKFDIVWGSWPNYQRGMLAATQLAAKPCCISTATGVKSEHH